MVDKFSPAIWLEDSLDWIGFKNVDQHVLKLAFKSAESWFSSFWQSKTKPVKHATGFIKPAYVINKENEEPL